MDHVKYKGLWTPKYMAENLLFPKPVLVWVAELSLKSWANDIVEVNALVWINPLECKPESNRKIIFKLKSTDKRMGIFLPKDQWDRENIFCDGSFHNMKTVTGWIYVPD